jgi:brefeldin A-inhibited guanine nucleotide-exchange protein
LDIIKQYNLFDNEARQRNLSAWRPVILNILTAFSKFDDDNFKRHIQKFYSPAIKLLLQEMSSDMRQAIYEILERTGKLFGLIDLSAPSESSNALNIESTTK